MYKFGNIRYVFLDRDGVINVNPPEGSYVHREEDFHLLLGVEEAISWLNSCGHTVIVVTNQRGIALGLYGHRQVQRIHACLQERLRIHRAHIDAFYYCPHDRDQCECRKPKPGLITQAFQDFPEANLANSILIGDSLTDIEAGRRLGMKTIFLQGPSQHQKPDAERARALAEATCASLLEAVQTYLQS